MMIYVALLRGINVGGNSKVEMPRLKTVFEYLDCEKVKTYINSGNVIFQDKRTAKVLVPLIEKAILKEFGLEIHIVLREMSSIAAICKKVPADWTNNKEHKTDVLFLWDEVDNSDVLKEFKINAEIEDVEYISGAIIWHIGRSDATRNGMLKIIGTPLYKQMTIRNINTVRKLYSLMNELETN